MARILVVDDDPHILRTLEIMLRGDGHTVLTAASGEAAMRVLGEETVEVALVDLQLPGMDGVDVLRHIKDRHPGVEVVIITAHGTIETAVAAMKEGAFDYLTKPFAPDQVRHRLRQIERVQQMSTEIAALKRRVDAMPYSGEFVTQSPVVLNLLETAARVAASDVTILVRGESGTGKTLLAKLIHQSSARADGPFMTVDCTAFQESLLESELFGHARGAFTGAVSDKPGKVELADGGTLFLDEIGEVPLHLQSKLLRLVEEQTFERVGDPRPRSINARIIAATHRDLEGMVAERAFREDLFYRLSVVDLTLPPLRSRPEDILLLARACVENSCRVYRRTITGWDAGVERCLLRHRWPGNVRELAHTIERAVVLCPGRTLLSEHLPQRIREGAHDTSDDGLLSLIEVEEQHIRRALDLGLTQEETARLLGIDPSTLWRKRKKYNI